MENHNSEDYDSKDHTPSARARGSDPSTSQQAAQTDMTELENLVYKVIHSFGAKGCISDDVLVQFLKSQKNVDFGGSVTPRYKKLLEKKLIVVPRNEEGDDFTRIAKSNKQQRVMVASVHLTAEELASCQTTRDFKRCECCGQIIKNTKPIQ